MPPIHETVVLRGSRDVCLPTARFRLTARGPPRVVPGSAHARYWRPPIGDWLSIHRSYTRFGSRASFQTSQFIADALRVRFVEWGRNARRRTMVKNLRNTNSNSHCHVYVTSLPAVTCLIVRKRRIVGRRAIVPTKDHLLTWTRRGPEAPGAACPTKSGP